MRKRFFLLPSVQTSYGIPGDSSAADREARCAADRKLPPSVRIKSGRNPTSILSMHPCCAQTNVYILSILYLPHFTSIPNSASQTISSLKYHTYPITLVSLYTMTHISRWQHGNRRFKVFVPRNRRRLNMMQWCIPIILVGKRNKRPLWSMYMWMFSLTL